MNCCMYLQEAFKYQISLAYECFPLCYLNSSSFVVNVSPVCCFIFFLLIWDNRKIAQTLQRRCVERKALRTVEPDNSAVLIIAFMSCGYKHKLLIFLLMEILPRVRKCHTDCCLCCVACMHVLLYCLCLASDVLFHTSMTKMFYNHSCWRFVALIVSILPLSFTVCVQQISANPPTWIH